MGQNQYNHGNMPVCHSQSGMLDSCTDDTCNRLDYENNIIIYYDIDELVPCLCVHQNLTSMNHLFFSVIYQYAESIIKATYFALSEKCVLMQARLEQALKVLNLLNSIHCY